MAGGVRFSLSGDFSASSTSIAALARLLAVSPPSFLAADTVQIAGKMHTTPTGVTLDEVTATAAGQTVRGAAQIDRPRAGRRLRDFGFRENRRRRPLWAARALVQPKWRLERNSICERTRRTPSISICDCRQGSLDIYRHELADAAASAILKDGVLNANLVDSEAFGGRLKGEIRLACVDESLRVDGSRRAHGRGFRCGFQEFRLARGGGKGKRRVRRPDRRSLASGCGVELGWSATLKLEQGSLTSLSLEQALRRSQHRPIDIDRDLRVGETTFDRLSLELALGKGVAHVVNGDLVAQGVEANLQGAIDLMTKAGSCASTPHRQERMEPRRCLVSTSRDPGRSRPFARRARRTTFRTPSIPRSRIATLTAADCAARLPACGVSTGDDVCAEECGCSGGGRVRLS